MKYEVVLSRSEGGLVVAECPELPGCISQGTDEAEALANIREASAGWIWAEEEKANESQL